MRSKQTREFVIDGKSAHFNAEAFKRAFSRYREVKSITVGELEEMLSENLNVTTDAVHNWRFHMNGPGDLSTIQKIAELFHIDFRVLLVISDGRKREGIGMNALTGRQMDAAKRVYDAIVQFLDEFKHTDGFNDFWYKFKDHGSHDPESDIYDLIESRMRAIYLVLNQEYFDLHGHEIYDELYTFVNEDLNDTFDGKVSYAYRFEAFPDNPSTEDDYNKATDALNAIIERYT